MSDRQGSAVDLLDTEASLRCGRDPQQLLEQVVDRGSAAADGHQASCPHCLAALAEFDRLWNPMRAVAAQRPGAPPGLLDAVLSSIRGVSEDTEFGRVENGFGHTRISGRVVAAIARHHAAQVPGVRVALGKLAAAGRRDLDRAEDFPESSIHAARVDDMPRRPQVSVGVAGASTAVEVVLAADYGVDLALLGERVRAAVSAGIRTDTGLEPVAVSVVVDDVLPPAGLS
ncbi:Asp23/Gls24 family envelope stress response protein [Actinomycetospora atypica]|uniref:Asp23/Gls24 family envelope stress response protein n=1 Tax=Actinomycetospora atypica TaxID=1290095 RepID=A0ABV9YLX6_9PSEU